MSQKFRVVSEDDDCFVLEDRRDGSSFKMAKKGMGPELVIRVKKMAEGGLVPPPEFVQEQPPVQPLPNRSVGQPALDPNYIDPELQRFQQLPQLQKDLLPPADRDRLYKADRDWQNRPKPKQLWEMNQTEREAAMNARPNPTVPAEAPPAPSEARTVTDMGGNGVLQSQSAQSAPTTSSKATAPARNGGQGSGNPLPKDEELAAAYRTDAQHKQEAAAAEAERQRLEVEDRKKFQDETNKLYQEHDKQAEEAKKAFLDKKIDPNRYYNNKSTASKIASALAIGLGAFGSGINHGPNFALDIINKATDADIDAQKEEKASLKEGWQMTVQDNQTKMARRNQMKIDQLAIAQAEAERLKTIAKGQEQKDNADIMIGQLKSQRDMLQWKAAEERAQQNRLFAHQKEMQGMELGAKMAAGKAPRQLSSESAAKIGELDAGIAGVKDLSEAYKKLPPGASFTQFFPGTEGKKYQDKLKVTAQVVGGILEGGKLTDPDYARYLDMMPKPGDSDGRAFEKIQSIATMLQIKRDAQVKALGQGGFDVGGYGQSDRQKKESFGFKAH